MFSVHTWYYNIYSTGHQTNKQTQTTTTTKKQQQQQHNNILVPSGRCCYKLFNITSKPGIHSTRVS